MSIPLALTVLFAVVGQAVPPADESSADADAVARLAVMKKVLAAYDVRSTDDPLRDFRLQADPVMRFSNTVGSTRDGAVFLWVGEHGRPAAAVQISLRRDGLWFHELSSLSERPLVAKAANEVPWTPNRGGTEFKPVLGAPKPATTPEQRLRQMRALTKDFSVEDHFRQKDWQGLRLLSKPFARYGTPGTDVIDGALFAYVLTTDPEALLLVEARQADGGPEWQFAFAPMTVYAVKASWKGQEVWNLPMRANHRAAGNPQEPFHVKKATTEP